MTVADIAGTIVALTLNSEAGLNYPAGLNATEVTLGNATMIGGST